MAGELAHERAAEGFSQERLKSGPVALPTLGFDNVAHPSLPLSPLNAAENLSAFERNSYSSNMTQLPHLPMSLLPHFDLISKQLVQQDSVLEQYSHHIQSNAVRLADHDAKFQIQQEQCQQVL